ncbi:MAG: helix-turn-helix transcriptional regulator [Anaerolineae bacterium]|jgi:transcriptional regulator with XRE-family HTH domain|nr:helix-turn-helix transcriptional regulator [Anaerolineae bacterium]
MKFEEFRSELRQNPEYVAAEKEREPFWNIANEVLRLRLEKGWSQSELARQAGTKQANISKLENGLANPTLEFLQKVATALGVDLTVHLRDRKAS